MHVRKAATDEATQMAKLHQSIQAGDGTRKGAVVLVTDSDTGLSIELPLEPAYGVECPPSFPPKLN